MDNVIIYTLVALYVLGAVAVITSIGKPRKPITSGYAAGIVLFDAAAIVALLSLR